MNISTLKLDNRIEKVPKRYCTCPNVLRIFFNNELLKSISLLASLVIKKSEIF